MIQREDEALNPYNILTARDGIRFVAPSPDILTVTEIPEYRFADIQSTDKVLDIGANAGAFSLRAARLSPAVVAVEPVTVDILSRNVRLNNAPVRIIRGALGDGRPAEIHWGGLSATVQTYRLRDLIAMTGGCDFLKCDCEGAEWDINPSDLDGVRRIEMELHLPPIGGLPNPVLLDYITEHYHFSLDRVTCHGPLGLLGYLHAERK